MYRKTITLPHSRSLPGQGKPLPLSAIDACRDAVDQVLTTRVALSVAELRLCQGTVKLSLQLWFPLTMSSMHSAICLEAGLLMDFTVKADALVIVGSLLGAVSPGTPVIEPSIVGYVFGGLFFASGFAVIYEISK